MERPGLLSLQRWLHAIAHRAIRETHAAAGSLVRRSDAIRSRAACPPLDSGCLRRRRRGDSMSARRVAFFTDSFNEVNGVALTSREFVRFARRRGLPMFSVHAGPEKGIVQDGSVTTFEFQRGPVRWNLEHDLAIDLLFLR